MKKFTVLAAAILAAGTLVSCGSSGGSSSPEETSSPAKPTISQELSEKAKENMQKQLEKAKESSKSLSKSSIPLDKDARTAAEDFITCMFTNKPEKVMEYMYPKELCEPLIKAGAAGNFQSADVDQFEMKEFNVLECSRLAPDTGYKAVERYFETTAKNNGISSVGVTVANGYSVNLKFRVVVDGEEDTDTEDAVIVYIENDGWKVIPLSIGDITEQLDTVKDKEN